MLGVPVGYERCSAELRVWPLIFKGMSIEDCNGNSRNTSLLEA